jgi:hypothetical protein
LNADKIARVLSFRPRQSVDDAIASLCAAYQAGRIPQPESTHYHNIKRMEELVRERCLTS